jgi:hypothetical protein
LPGLRFHDSFELKRKSRFISFFACFLYQYQAAGKVKGDSGDAGKANAVARIRNNTVIINSVRDIGPGEELLMEYSQECGHRRLAQELLVDQLNGKDVTSTFEARNGIKPKNIDALNNIRSTSSQLSKFEIGDKMARLSCLHDHVVSFSNPEVEKRHKGLSGKRKTTGPEDFPIFGQESVASSSSAAMDTTTSASVESPIAPTASSPMANRLRSRSSKSDSSEIDSARKHKKPSGRDDEGDTGVASSRAHSHIGCTKIVESIEVSDSEDETPEDTTFFDQDEINIGGEPKSLDEADEAVIKIHVLHPNHENSDGGVNVEQVSVKYGNIANFLEMHQVPIKDIPKSFDPNIDFNRDDCGNDGKLTYSTEEEKCIFSFLNRKFEPIPWVENNPNFVETPFEPAKSSDGEKEDGGLKSSILKDLREGNVSRKDATDPMYWFFRFLPLEFWDQMSRSTTLKMLNHEVDLK